MKDRFARFVIRNDENSGLILGKQWNNLLKPNTVYQINNIIGELMIKEIGPSAIGDNNFDSDCSVNWGYTANEIVKDGCYLYTKEEYKKVCERDNKNDSI